MADRTAGLGECLLASLPPARASAVLTALRAVAQRLPGAGVVDWSAVADDDLARATADWTAGCRRATAHTRRCLLKCGLRRLVDGPALRWPSFWTLGRAARQTTQREATVANVLPHRVYRAGPRDPMWTVLERLVCLLRRHSAMRRPTSLRKALGFWYAFTTEQIVTDGSSPDRILSCLQAQTPTSLVEAYRRFRSARRPVGLSVLTRQVQLVSLLFHNVLRTLKEPLHPALFGLRSGVRRRAGPCPKRPVPGPPFALDGLAGWVAVRPGPGPQGSGRQREPVGARAREIGGAGSHIQRGGDTRPLPVVFRSV